LHRAVAVLGAPRVSRELLDRAEHLWQIVVLGLLAGAGLPALFATAAVCFAIVLNRRGMGHLAPSPPGW
jgi:hypothetical protein